MKKLRWVSLSLLLLLISGAALASDPTLPSISADAVTNHTDLSVSFLAQIFGSVGNVLQGTSGQMLGKLLYEFNFGILIIAGVWLLGTTLMVTVRSATEGSFMGQNNKVPLVILRVALGIILLIPNAQTGYSLGQDLMMQIVVTGAKLGDMVWSYGLNYLNDGGQLWVMPTTGGANENGGTSSAQLLDSDSISGSGNIGDGILGSTGVGAPGGPLTSQLGLAQRVFASEVCMVASSVYKEKNAALNAQSANMNGITVTAGDTTSYYTPYEDDANNVIFFPGATDPFEHSGFDPASNQGYGCGYVAWDGVAGTTFNENDSNTCHVRGVGTGNSGSHCEFSRLAVTSMVNDLMPAAKKYACAKYAGGNTSSSAVCTGAESDNLDNDVVNALYNATLNFANAITPLANSQSEVGQNLNKTFIQEAEDEGWLSAGRFYWDLVHMESLTQKISKLNTYVPQGVNKDFSSNSSTSVIMSPHEDSSVTAAYSDTNESNKPNDIGKTVNYFLSNLYATRGTDNSTGYTQSVITQLAHESQASNQGSENGNGYDGPDSFGLLFLNAIIPVVGDMGRLVNLFGNDQMGGDPILFLHNVGAKCLDIAGDIWFAPIGSLFGMLLLYIICNADLNGSAAVGQVVDWIRPLFMVMCAAFLGCGALLGIYIPLYPYIIWVCSLIGSWIIPVIEIMVATPIICLGITNSQGHDIWGRAEHAINMVLIVLLRPPLMVIGLIASIITSFVALKMIVYGFSGVTYDLFSSGFDGHLGPQDVQTASAHAMHMMMSNYKADTEGALVVAAGSGSGAPVMAVGGLAHIATAAMTRLLVLPLFVMTFAFVVWDIVVQCYKLVYLLGNVINYIGGRAENHGIDSMISGIQQSVSGVGNKLGQGLAQSSSLMKPVAKGGGNVVVK